MSVVAIGGFDKIENPILLKLTPKTGLPLDGVRINYNVPTIQGFLALESPDVKYATLYISLDNIASFTVLDEESFNIQAAFPELKIKTREY